MPGLRQKLLEAARGLRSVPSSGSADARGIEADARPENLRQAELRIEKQQDQLRKQSRELEDLRARVAESVHGTEHRGIDAGNVVWILGTARTGSTWLASMMEELHDHTVWREPYVGELFGRPYHNWVGEKHFETKHFILGSRSKESWLRSMRHFVLSEANARFPEVASDGYLVVKEPNGSIGAPLMMEALPESRLIFLIRDPRDVAASALDASRKGSWLHKRRNTKDGRTSAMFDMEADAFVERVAKRYVRNISSVREAFEKHGGPEVLIRYEDLVADTPGAMKRMYSALGIPVDEGELVRAVEKHSWERIPEEEKGEGKFHRKATPGGWREDLSPEQAETVESITAPLLEEFYPG